MREYSKPPLSIDQQIELLKSRGLLVTDNSKARSILCNINYYRLSAYCIPFERAKHTFKDGITIETIKELYEFDRCLRFLIDEALEVIEISLRAKLAYYLSHKDGAFAHEDGTVFFPSKGFDHLVWLGKVHEEINRSKETFVQHYRYNYLGFPKIPIWMAVEVMSFGSLSKIFHNLRRTDQIEIAKEYGLNHRILATWLHAFTYVRNICAHHGRLWNKELAIKMEVPKNAQWNDVNPRRIVSVIYAINHVLKVVGIDDKITMAWHTEISAHMDKPIMTELFLNAIGTNAGFKEHVLWKN